MGGKVLTLYAIHTIVALVTIFISVQSGFAPPWLLIVILFPLVLAFSSKLRDVSYNLNVRILFPVSVGLFFVVLFDYMPDLLISQANTGTVSFFGVKADISPEGKIPESFFEVNTVFKDAVSVLYAICAAFMLFKGLNDFDALKHTLYEEAGQIKSIFDFSDYFVLSGKPEDNSESVRSLRLCLLEYVENILEGDKVVVKKENEAVLKRCISSVSELRVGDTNDQIALEEIMKGIANLSVLRSRRVVCIEKKMSPYILVLMTLMSLTMVFSFFGKTSEGLSIEYAYVFLLPVFYTSIFMTLIDLSSPFDGYWSIKLHALEGVRNSLRSELPGYSTPLSDLSPK